MDVTKPMNPLTVCNPLDVVMSPFSQAYSTVVNSRDASSKFASPKELEDTTLQNHSMIMLQNIYVNGSS